MFQCKGKGEVYAIVIRCIALNRRGPDFYFERSIFLSYDRYQIRSYKNRSEKYNTFFQERRGVTLQSIVYITTRFEASKSLETWNKLKGGGG